jgi:hypothetical protein
MGPGLRSPTQHVKPPVSHPGVLQPRNGLGWVRLAQGINAAVGGAMRGPFIRSTTAPVDNLPRGGDFEREKRFKGE